MQAKSVSGYTKERERIKTPLLISVASTTTIQITINFNRKTLGKQASIKASMSNQKIGVNEHSFQLPNLLGHHN